MTQFIKIKVFGRVQGVLFRDFTRRNARAIGIVGFVMNKDDGSVEIVAGGKEEDLKRLIEKVKIGSVFSKVTNVIFEPYINNEEFTNFNIKYSSFWDRI
jgi:acylphosphatase